MKIAERESALADREAQQELAKTLGELGESIQESVNRPIQATVVQPPPPSAPPAESGASREERERAKKVRVHRPRDQVV
jgi:hypothetical protein